MGSGINPLKNPHYASVNFALDIMYGADKGPSADIVTSYFLTPWTETNPCAWYV